VTGEPSAAIMCASYAAWPSASVSTRTIVPPLTFALAAAVTLSRASPDSGVSSDRCGPQGWAVAELPAEELLGLLLEPEPFPPAAAAIP
jgi:hypothetical protein